MYVRHYLQEALEQVMAEASGHHLGGEGSGPAPALVHWIEELKRCGRKHRESHRPDGGRQKPPVSLNRAPLPQLLRLTWLLHANPMENNTYVIKPRIVLTLRACRRAAAALDAAAAAEAEQRATAAALAKQQEALQKRLEELNTRAQVRAAYFAAVVSMEGSL